MKTDHEKGLRDRAANAAAKIEGANAVLAQAERLNQAEQQHLETMRAEIAERKHRLDPNDLAAVGDLAAREKQLEMLQAKAAKDGKQRTEAAHRESASHYHAADLAGFFAAAHDLHVQRLRDTLAPYFNLPLQERAMAQLINDLPGVERLRAMKNYPPQPEKALEILTRFIEGAPLWRC